ncbi:MAG: macro domain-containing protein [Pseudomonadota bacterium]
MREKKIKNTTLRIIRDDITLLDVDAFVFYAQSDLELGSGVGNAIAQRGGPAVKDALKGKGPLSTGQAIATTAGDLKASFIVHAMGPRFQEANMESKLEATMRSVLSCAQKKGVKRLALPPLGHGFYGVPLELSARVTLRALGEHLKNGSALNEVVLCMTDERQAPPFEKQLDALVG